MIIDENKIDKNNIGNAGEYYIAHVLSARGFVTTITLGRAESYDLIAINPKGRTIKLQVKTLSGSGVQWRMSEKDGVPKNNEGFFYAFVRLNNLLKSPEFWIIPAKVVSDYIPENHRTWKNALGKKGQQHNDTKIRSFRVKSDKYTPQNWTEKCKEYYQNIKPLLD